jgi:hypothetical protein
LIGGQVFYQIKSDAEFYATLGEKQDLRNSGLTREEFLWDRYRRDGAKKSQPCFQSQIAIYLHNHSNTFNKLYGTVYDAMIGKCDLSCVDSSDAHCVKCPMSPSKSV